MSSSTSSSDRSVANAGLEQGSHQACHAMLFDPSALYEPVNASLRKKSKSNEISFQSTRKVSFEDDTLIYDVTTSFLNSKYVQPFLDEAGGKATCNQSTNSNTSQSLSSLTRSGDLKSLLESVARPTVPTVSEEDLSSSLHRHELEDVHYSCSDTMHDSHKESCTPMETSSPDHTTCSGWGQFVDVVPQEHYERATAKQFNQKRRLRPLFSSTRYRPFSKQRMNKSSSSRWLKKAAKKILHSTPSMKTTVSTDDVAVAMGFQLSLSDC